MKIAGIDGATDELDLMDEYAKEGIVHSLTEGAKLDSGKLTSFDGGLYFDGEVSGGLHVNGTLIIGKNAIVRGSVTANNIYNYGDMQVSEVLCHGIFVNRGSFMGSLKSPPDYSEGASRHEDVTPTRKILGGLFSL
jgi:hypothetical protein